MLQGSHSNKLRRLLIVYVIIYALIKIIFIFSCYDLFSEESQYWLWSRHLDWSYYSKPPLIAWINFITEQLFGHSDRVIRFTALGFGLATMFVFYKVAIELFDNIKIAIVATAILSISPYFILATTFFTTDTLLLFFWTVTFYLFLKGLKSKSSIIWLMAGVTFGLGYLSKYSMLFFIFILLVPFLWEIDRSTYIKQLLVMSVMALLMSLPVFLWNYNHDWISMKHVNSLATGTSNSFDFIKSLRNAGEFAGGVILVNSPFFAVLFFKGFMHWNKSDRQIEKQNILLLAIPLAISVLVFFVISIFSPVEINWPSMSYLSLPLLMAHFVVNNNHSRLFIISSSATAALLIFLLFPRLQDYVGLSSYVPIEFDSMKRMAGWKELSEKVKEIENSYQDRECVFIFSSSYHISSSVSFYLNKDQVFCIAQNRRKNQFDLWESINKYENTDCYGIYISDQTIHPSIREAFENEIAVTNVPILYRGHIVRNFNIYVLKNFSGWHIQPAASY